MSERALEGKVALVTGASRGLGAAVARRLARHGADVGIHYGTSSGLAEVVAADVRGQGVRAETLQADLGRSREAYDLVHRTVATMGRLDILINNAATLFVDDYGSSQAAPPGEPEAIFTVNVLSAASAVRAAAEVLPSGGRIVNVGSIGGQRARRTGIADYCATKAALGGYTRAWARDLGPRNITVNLVQPGFMLTDMMQDASPDGGLAALSALGRHGTADEVAAMIAFLALPEASFVTGATITVDGGMLA